MRLAARLCLLNATSRMMQADGFEGEMSPEVHGPACPSPLLSPVSAPNPSRPSASEPGVHAMQAALAAVWRAVESDAAAKPDETPLPIYPSPATPWQDRARRALQPLADRFNAWFAALDIAQDLSEDIGSPRWRRGLGVFVASLLALALLAPPLAPLQAAPAMRLDDMGREAMAEQAVMPLALGADTGSHMGPTPDVVRMAVALERPRIQLSVPLAQGDSFVGMLRRIGVGTADAAQAQALVGQVVSPDSIASGTMVDVTLGARPADGGPRPLDHLGMRARFDMALRLDRTGGGLSLARDPILVDATPLRIRGIVGQSLFASARAAGAPLLAIQQFLQTLDAHVGLDSVHPGDTFDLILDYQRAAGGEAHAGPLLYAGVEQGGRPRAQILRWADGSFYDADDPDSTRGNTGFVLPVQGGHITSGFGMRFHPILGYTRMHAGVDLGAPWGSPIYAVADGVVEWAGPHGGHGNFVRLAHADGMGTGYAHMSRIAVTPGMQVRAGQIIGFVGSTGLSTGPHLHFEVYRDGQVIDPATARFAAHAGLATKDRAAFRARLARLLLVPPGAALRPLDLR